MSYDDLSGSNHEEGSVRGETMRAEIFERIRPILSRYDAFGMRILPTSRLVDDLNMDSLDLVALAIDLQTEFGIEISDAELSSSQYFGTVERVGDFIQAKLDNAGPVTNPGD